MELINKIKELLLNNDNVVQLLGLVVTVIIAFFTAYVTANRERKKSATEHFKQAGIEKQKDVLTFWYKINNYYDETVKEYKKKYKLNENSDDAELMKLVMADCYIYSSKQSIRAVADYMQYTFKNKGKTSKTLLVLVARVISLLKYDFTGEKTNAIDILKLRINDYNFKMAIKLNIILFYYRFKNIIRLALFLIIVCLFCLIIF